MKYVKCFYIFRYFLNFDLDLDLDLDFVCKDLDFVCKMIQRVSYLHPELFILNKSDIFFVKNGGTFML